MTNSITNIQQIQYNVHILLTLKNKTLIITLLQILFILLLTNLVDYTCCMTNESENGSEISSVFDYDDDYIEHTVAPLGEHLTDLYERQFIENTDVNALTPIERDLGPIFEYLKHHNEEYIEHITEFDNQPLPVKIKALQNVYFTESLKNEILEDCLEKQTEQLFRRHEALVESKGAVRELTQENLELKQYITQLEEQLAKMSQRK